VSQGGEWDDVESFGGSDEPSLLTDDDGGSDEFDPSLQPLRPPLAWLWAAAIVLVLAIGLLFVGQTSLNIVGYLLAPLIVLSLVSVFRFKDQRLSMSPNYSPRLGLPLTQIQVVLLVTSVVVGACHTWPLAWEFARWLKS
jgi:hypothetical protein